MSLRLVVLGSEVEINSDEAERVDPAFRYTARSGTRII